MAKTIINIKTDKEVKKNAQKLAKKLGLSLSDVLNASLRNFIRTREIRFSAVPYMMPEFEKLLGTIEGDINNKRNLSPHLKTVGKVRDYLNSL